MDSIQADRYLRLVGLVSEALDGLPGKDNPKYRAQLIERLRGIRGVMAVRHDMPVFGIGQVGASLGLYLSTCPKDSRKRRLASSLVSLIDATVEEDPRVKLVRVIDSLWSYGPSGRAWKQKVDDLNKRLWDGNSSP